MAALINSSLAGSRSGSVNVPSTPPRDTRLVGVIHGCADQQQLGRQPVGQRERPFHAAESDDHARLRPAHEVLRHRTRLDVSTSFGVMLMQPSGRPGSEVIEYARQWCTPSTTMPTRRY